MYYIYTLAFVVIVYTSSQDAQLSLYSQTALSRRKITEMPCRTIPVSFPLSGPENHCGPLAHASSNDPRNKPARLAMPPLPLVSEFLLQHPLLISHPQCKSRYGKSNNPAYPRPLEPIQFVQDVLRDPTGKGSVPSEEKGHKPSDRNNQSHVAGVLHVAVDARGDQPIRGGDLEGEILPQAPKGGQTEGRADEYHRSQRSRGQEVPGEQIRVEIGCVGTESTST